MEGSSFAVPGYPPSEDYHCARFIHAPSQKDVIRPQLPQRSPWGITPERHAELQVRNPTNGNSEMNGVVNQSAYQFHCGNEQNMNGSIHFSNGARNPNQSFIASHRVQYDQQTFFKDQRHKWDAYTSSEYYAPKDRKALTCGPCNRTFWNKMKLNEHLKNHVDCPFPECKMSADSRVIENHINNQHMLVNFAALQIDDETWIAERKKRFPSAKRAELRRAEQMEKFKRGEMLGLKSKPFKKERFGNMKGNMKKKGKYQGGNVREKICNEKKASTNTIQNESTETKEVGSSRGRHRKRRHRKQERFAAPKKPRIDELYESDDEVKGGIKAFKGTKSFYENTGEVSYFAMKNSVGVSDCGDSYREETKLVISDDEEWETNNSPTNSGSGVYAFGGALGSLMGAYSDSEEENESESPLGAKKGHEQKNHNSSKVENELAPRKEIGSDMNKKIEANTVSSEKKAAVHKRNKQQPKTKGRVFTKKNRFRGRRKTLLERLLLPDIIHERNVILQCIRYIVGKNYFDGDDFESSDQFNSTNRNDEGKIGTDKDIKDNSEEGSVRDDSEAKMALEEGIRNYSEIKTAMEECNKDNSKTKTAMEECIRDNSDTKNAMGESIRNDSEAKTAMERCNTDDSEIKTVMKEHTRYDSEAKITVKECNSDNLEAKTATEECNTDDSYTKIAMKERTRYDSEVKIAMEEHIRDEAKTKTAMEESMGDNFEAKTPVEEAIRDTSKAKVAMEEEGIRDDSEAEMAMEKGIKDNSEAKTTIEKVI